MYCLLFKVISLFVAFVFLQNVCRNVSNENYLSIQGSRDNKSGFLLSLAEGFIRQMRRISNKGNRKIISVYKPVCLASTINNSQSDNCGNEHLTSKSYNHPNRNSTKVVVLINKSNLLPELHVCSVEDSGQFLKNFGNITSLYQQQEQSLSQATDLVTEMLLSEEVDDIKKNSHEQIAHEDIATEPKMLLNKLSEEGIIPNVYKFTDGGNETQGTLLDFKLTSSSNAAMFYNSFELVDKTLTSNYINRKIVAQQQFKPSLNPELANLDSVGQRFTSNTNFEKNRNDSEKCRTSNSIVYHLVVVILENLPDGIYKNLDREYHRIVEEYDRRQIKGREKYLYMRHLPWKIFSSAKLHFAIIKYFVTTLSFLGLLRPTKVSLLMSQDIIYHSIFFLFRFMLNGILN